MKKKKWKKSFNLMNYNQNKKMMHKKKKNQRNQKKQNEFFTINN